MVSAPSLTLPRRARARVARRRFAECPPGCIPVPTAEPVRSLTLAWPTLGSLRTDRAPRAVASRLPLLAGGADRLQKFTDDERHVRRNLFVFPDQAPVVLLGK